MTTWRVLSATAVALLLAASMPVQEPALAQGMMQQSAPQPPPPVRVRATIEKVDGTTLTVKARDGAEMTVNLADVKPGSYIAVTGMPQPDGSQKALAVFIFPEAQRGLAEGHRPWDFAANSTMTNATVDSQVAGVQGQTLAVKYKDGEQKFLVTPATQITAATRKSAADLKPGQKMSVFAAKKLSDGTLEAPNISFGDYGVWR